MGLTSRLRSSAGRLFRSDWPTISLDQWASWFAFGANYPLSLNQTLKGTTEQLDGTFISFVQQAYKSNGIVFACMLARSSIFSEARFQFQELRDENGRPGDLFGTAALDVLEHPWPGGVTGDLLTKAISDADLAGNAFLARRPARIKRMRPDWVTMVLGSESDPEVDAADIDAEVLGYIYHPGGRTSGRAGVPLLREEVAHFAPITDPLASFRGMSWLTPVVREVMGDSAATSHKLRFFENGATPNMVVSLDKDIALQAFTDWVAKFKEKEPRGFDAYKTLYLGAGAKIEVVGKDLQQLDFKLTQGAGETRVAVASGMHSVIVGLSEGLAGSSLNVGNFQSARRLVADKTIWPLWRNLAGSLETIVPPPPRSRLWIDARDIPFLREDRKDAAEIQKTKADTIRTLVDAGYTAKSAVDAVEAEDMGRLKHSGLFSVQLQAPGSTKMPLGEAPGEIPVGGDSGQTGPEKPTSPTPKKTPAKAG